MKNKISGFFEPIKQEVNPMNGNTTSSSVNSTSNFQIHSISTSTSTSNVVPAMLKSDQWIVDGASKYNLSEMCRQFEKMQKMIEIVFTPANELSPLMVSEDEETRELATTYFDKLQLDIRLLRD